MTDRAVLGHEPQACPFVALDDDRDRRLDIPDERHRCYAEPEPRPRALPHQEAYCLSPRFPGCPVFLDWAARAAADPIATRREVPGTELLSSHTDADAPDRAADPASRGWATPPPWGSGQLSAFPEAEDAFPALDPTIYTGAGDDGDPPPPRVRPSLPPPPAPRPPLHPDELARREVAPPTFLAGRSGPARARLARQARPVETDGQRKETTHGRAEGEPEWSRPHRLEAYPSLGRRAGLRAVPPILLGLVVVVIAAVALFALPGFLAGVDGPTSAPPSSVAVVTPSPAPTPTPEPTPVTYEVMAGDTMEGIARRFALTIGLIACANGITDIDRLSIGQILMIPDDDFECAAPSPSAS